MKIYNVWYLLKEGVKSIFQHGFMSFAAVTVIIACLIITGSFGLLAYNVSSLITRAEDENELYAFVEDTLTDTEALALAGKIYAVPNVRSAEFISRDEAFVEYSDELGEDANWMLDGLESDVLRHRYKILVEDISATAETAEEIGNIEGIGNVRYSYELADGIITVRNVLNAVAVVIGAVLLLVSILMISNTVRLANNDRREEIFIMKMVGATNAFVRWPFLVQGFLLGLFGAIIAFFLEMGIYIYAGRLITQYAPVLTLIPFQSIAPQMLIAFLVVGFVVGVIGGSTTIRRFMNV